MKQTITFQCPLCGRIGKVEATEGDILCPHCGTQKGKIDRMESFFDQCPLCECRQFYLSKDFNQFVGLLILAMGIFFVPKTYGLSLPLFALVDWILYKRVPTIVNCYRCAGIFRGFDYPKHLKPFSHHTGILFDRSKS